MDGPASLDNQHIAPEYIYHLLSRTLGQGVAIAQVIDLNVFDVISICDVNCRIRLVGARLVQG